jgi:hypothetical protein
VMQDRTTTRYRFRNYLRAEFQKPETTIHHIHAPADRLFNVRPAIPL